MQARCGDFLRTILKPPPFVTSSGQIGLFGCMGCGDRYPIPKALLSLPSPTEQANREGSVTKEADMGINTERDIEANLQIGPTDHGMVRLFVEAGSAEIPMDFTADEAEEIADEIRAAAQAARAVKP